jgi:hypothetical protein
MAKCRAAQSVARAPDFAYSRRMTVRTRKLIGTVVLVLFLAFYALVVANLSAGRITTAPALAQFAFFLVAGLAWVVPAGLLIRWMQRPDA